MYHFSPDASHPVGQLGNHLLKFQFDNSFQKLPKIMFEVVEPTPIHNAHLVAVSEKVFELFDLKSKDVDLNEFGEWLNGTKEIPGEQRISTRYAGHQFGQWAGQLGDGRAISLGEIINSKNERWEIQVKGSGLTPFSRMGDGKAVIRSSVREYLCSEAMAGLGIPTTRALALITGSDDVYRETIERSAIVARVFPTNIRFGHFEYAFHFKQEEALKALVDYTRETFFAGKSNEEMLKEIILSTADLIAQWQAVGFNHGVMNTDNMSILGITIDYGPFGFLEDTQLNHICNHSDSSGRYAYYKQPGIAFWNLERLLVCFMPFVAKEKLEELLAIYPDRYQKQWTRAFLAKLGLDWEEGKSTDDHEPIIMDLLKVMHDLQWDFTYFFRKLCDYEVGKIDSLGEFWKTYSPSEEFKTWLLTYDDLLLKQNKQGRREQMKKINPKYILRNYIAQEVIEDVESDKNEKLMNWQNIFYMPFDEHPEYEQYAKPTPMNKKSIEVSCSS